MGPKMKINIFMELKIRRGILVIEKDFKVVFIKI